MLRPYSVFFYCAMATTIVVHSVQLKKPFKFVNTGDFTQTYSDPQQNHRKLPLAKEIYELRFYNTTPDGYTLGLVASTAINDFVRIYMVWEANVGNPVGEMAVLALGDDGNLVLSDSDGRIAWQSNTASKGVTGIDLLSTGNMVLYDAKGNYVWQSFDHPTDTLLLGQSLKRGGPTELVNGAYKLVMEDTRVAIYYTSPLDSRSYIVFSFAEYMNPRNRTLQQFFISASRKKSYYEIGFAYQLASSSVIEKALTGGLEYEDNSSWKPIHSLMQLPSDGDVYVHSFGPGIIRTWEESFNLFCNDPDSCFRAYCELPSNCGFDGICFGNDYTCTCPFNSSQYGNCQNIALTTCSPKDFVYKRLAGIDHFSSRYSDGDGPMSEEACSAKCTNDCKCKGFFYHQTTSRCWAVGDLMTMQNTTDSSHLAYIKVPV